ncbi:thioredoxin family protein [Mucilaginibacter ginsenosidivorax]|uniref:Thioredoxin family protein n=1 Tax=Mucilaginibacter ginsenosidivorax TaxID=862126 RepID=A0A5B8W8W3_9SPHI|nr:thioredoxin family protein [Mucilaginibacter ginsenosidivorax]QEC78688.1 thioredoxin family protein [Mucilaginibacter ginsenosidivorax]
MDFIAYQQLFQHILMDTNPRFPYDDPHYLNYTRLNWSRQERWLKVGALNEELVELITGINTKQNWTIITEPWCGDASHSLPFIHRLSELNPLIEVDYQLRDSEPFLINSYLTRGSKSIPKLIIADAQHQDLATWGPRPAGCQVLYEQLVKDHVVMEQQKIALQQWYNADKGVSLQQELIVIFKAIVRS